METDSNRPSTIRIISGIIMMIIGIALGTLSFLGMSYLTELPFEKLWIFNFLWGKLLILFISGMIFILAIVLIAVCTYMAFTILKGKQYPMGHVIYPFPIVLTKEIVRDMKIERADDEFLIFELEFILRKIFIIFGGIPAFALACAIYADIDKPYSDVYFPPTPDMQF